jgi:phosphoglycolate phosphatase
MKESFFFIDLDGTLIDSKYRVYKLFIDLTKSSISFEDYWKIKETGKTNHDVLNHLQVNADAELPTFNKDWFKLIEARTYLSIDVLLPKSMEALEKLAQFGKLILVTSRQSKENTHWQLQELGVSRFFHDIIVTEHKKVKPLALADWIQVNKDGISHSSFMIGDTEEDLQASVQNNLKAIGVLTGFRSEAFLKELAFSGYYDSLYHFSKSISLIM